jgi:hypothetical protein
MNSGSKDRWSQSVRADVGVQHANVDSTKKLELLVDACNFGELEPEVALTMSDDNLEAANTKNAPDRMQPSVLAGAVADEGKVQVRLPPTS